ncbi:MAG: hypothetical protein AAGJ35_09800, partial [Myxococcota bacterium]
SMYWGFLNFLLGWPLFLLWFLWLERSESQRPWWFEWSTSLGLLVLLYTAHILWFGVAGLWWLCASVVRMLRREYRDWRRLLREGLCFMLLSFPILLWWPFLQQRRMLINTKFSMFWMNLTWKKVEISVFGALRGVYEQWVLLGIFGILIVGVIMGLLQKWNTPKRSITTWIDVPSLRLGAMLLLVVLCVPDGYRNIKAFAGRWLPFVLLAWVWACAAWRVPCVESAVQSRGRGSPIDAVLRWSRWIFGVLWMLMATGFWWQTRISWQRFEQQELQGLSLVLRRLPPQPRVLGLDFLPVSQHLLVGRVFLHMSAYAQVLHGGRLAYSFAELPSSLVVFRDPQKYSRFERILWNPFALRRSHLNAFTHVIIHARAPQQQALRMAYQLEPRSPPALWRLYRVPQTR